MDLRAFGAFALLAITRAAPPTYDQRQNGSVNVQIDVKDLQILAFLDSDVLDEYVNYDYPYDYADFTIKPRPTPGKPLGNGTSTTSTESTWPFWPTNPSSSTSSSTSSTPSSTTDLTKSTTSSPTTDLTTSTTPSPMNDLTTKFNEKATPSQQFIPGTVIVPIVTESHQPATTMSFGTHKDIRPLHPNRRVDVVEPRKRCPAGFHLKSGRCFKRRLSFISPRVGMIKLIPEPLSNPKLLKTNITA